MYFVTSYPKRQCWYVLLPWKPRILLLLLQWCFRLFGLQLKDFWVNLLRHHLHCLLLKLCNHQTIYVINLFVKEGFALSRRTSYTYLVDFHIYEKDSFFSVMVSQRVERTKTRRGKRILEDRAPKTVENDKKAIIVKGGKTNHAVTEALKDFYLMKKPLVQHLKRRNPIHPFEDETPLEKFSNKFDTSLFLFGSNSKKHPNSLTFGRMHDGQLLDMAELSITNYVPASQFEVPKMTLGSKPCIILEGTEFESEPTLKRIGNLLIDWFRGPVIDTIRLQGLESVVSFTAKENNIYMRVYRVVLKKSAVVVPRVELVEMGPSIDFVVDRKKLANESLFKAACRKPKALIAKRRKNMAEDVFGNQLARVHIGKQNTDAIQTRKVKALKKTTTGKPTLLTPPEAGGYEDEVEE
uniref:Ribosome production factor 2 homolog n=1 Tax=Heterorhabditis bacteriophora TaxID=37862 RepID=A0A1I7XHC5_HETBA